MARLDCHYYPDTPASWLCHACNAQYSDKCVPAGHSNHWGKRGPHCIRCEAELNYLGSATGAKPFWQMLPHFFVFPLHLNSLLVIAVVTFASLFLGGGLFTIAVFLFGLAVMVKYSLAIIESRGRGYAKPPGLGDVLGRDEHHLFFRQMAVFVLMGVIIGFAYGVNELLGLLVGGFITLAMPASIMLLAVDKSVRRALNPLAQLSLMTALGWPYLLLWFCMQIISAGPYYSFDLLLGVLPDTLVIPMLVAVSVYFTFVLYTMLGYVLFEYQQELGFSTLVDDDSMDARSFEKAKALGETRVFIKETDYSRARASLRKALDLVPDDMELHQHYHKLLMLLDDDTALINHAHYFIELAQRCQTLGKAVPIALDVQKRMPGFQLEDTGVALELARLLQMQGQHRAVVRLFHNMHKTRPDDPHLPDAYFLVAKVFFERLSDDVKAQALLAFLLKKYPQAKQRQEWLQLQNDIQSVKAPLKS